MGVVLFVALAVLGVAGLAAVATLGFLLADDRSTTFEPDAPLVVELVEMAYRPAEIVVPADTPSALLLRNAGSLQHDFSIDALRLSPDLRPGEERAIDLAAPAGRYEVYCTFPGHRGAGMTAVLIAQP